MLAPTHGLFAVILTLIVLAVFGVQHSLHWTILLSAVLGALLPDIDTPTSYIGRMISPISTRLERRYGHRTITHSLLGWTAAAAGVTGILLPYYMLTNTAYNWRIHLAFSLGYLSHLLLDMFTPRGVHLFWPDQARDVIPGNVKYRPSTGSKAEIVVFAVLVLLLIPALPLSKYGINSSLHWLLATPQSAIEEDKVSSTYTIVEYSGINAHMRIPVSGKAEMLEARNEKLVVLLDDAIYTIGSASDCDIIASTTRVSHTDLPLQINSLAATVNTLKELEKLVTGDVLISGVIRLPANIKAELPLRYGQSVHTIELINNELTLTYARLIEINKIRIIEVIKAEKRTEYYECLLVVRKTYPKLLEVPAPLKAVQIGEKTTGSNGVWGLGMIGL